MILKQRARCAPQGRLASQTLRVEAGQVIERVQPACLFGSGQQEVLPQPNIAISNDAAIEHKELDEHEAKEHERDTSCQGPNLPLERINASRGLLRDNRRRTGSRLGRMCQEDDVRGISDWTRGAMSNKAVGPDDDAPGGGTS